MRHTLAAALVLSGCLIAHPGAAEESQPAITMGNGANNWILLEDATRDGTVLTVPEVQIDGDGWLVMHPFENGQPNGDIYVGHSFVRDGKNENVEITMDYAPASGDMFIVMLHSDVDGDGEFDFVFVDDTHVEDRAVFEGTKMIGHAYAVP